MRKYSAKEKKRNHLIAIKKTKRGFMLFHFFIYLPCEKFNFIEFNNQLKL